MVRRAAAELASQPEHPRAVRPGGVATQFFAIRYPLLDAESTSWYHDDALSSARLLRIATDFAKLLAENSSDMGAELSSEALAQAQAAAANHPNYRPSPVPAHKRFEDTPRVAPRLLAEDAVNDLIRFSLVPAVIVPAIVPALEAALMQMVPTVLGNAVAASMGGTNPASPTKLRKPSESTIDTAVLVARLSAIRDQLTAVVDLCNGVEPSSKRDASPTKPPMPSVPEAAPFGGGVSKSPSRRPSALRRASTGGLPQTTAPPSAASAAAAAAEIAAARAAARRPSVDLPVTGAPPAAVAAPAAASGKERRGSRRGSKLGGGSDSYATSAVAPRQRQHRRPIALHLGCGGGGRRRRRAAAGGRARRRAVAPSERAAAGAHPGCGDAPAANGGGGGSLTLIVARARCVRVPPPHERRTSSTPAPGAAPTAPPQRAGTVGGPAGTAAALRATAAGLGAAAAPAPAAAAAAAAEFGDGYGGGMRWTAAGAEAEAEYAAQFGAILCANL